MCFSVTSWIRIDPQGTTHIYQQDISCSRVHTLKLQHPSLTYSSSRTGIRYSHSGAEFKTQSCDAAETADLILTKLTDVMCLFGD